MPMQGPISDIGRGWLDFILSAEGGIVALVGVLLSSCTKSATITSTSCLIYFQIQYYCNLKISLSL